MKRTLTFIAGVVVGVIVNKAVRYLRLKPKYKYGENPHINAYIERVTDSSKRFKKSLADTQPIKVYKW